MLAHANQPPPSLRALNPEVPADLEAVVLKCLAKLPTERYPDAASLAEVLRGCGCYGKWTREDAARWWATEAQAAVGVTTAVT